MTYVIGGRTLGPVDLVDDVVLLVPEHETVPEHSEHARLVDQLGAGFRDHFDDQPDVAVHERLAWFPDRDDTSVRLDPDVMIVRGRPQMIRSSYRAWMEEGIAPTVVIEVVSRRDTAADYARRLERLRKYGVPHVVLVDPYAVGGVRIEHLVAHDVRERPYRTVGVSFDVDSPLFVEPLGVTFRGGMTLVVDSGNGPWPDTAEAMGLVRELSARIEREQADAQQAQSEAQQATAEAQKAQADAQQAQARVAELEARLRAAGIDPA